MRIGRSNRLPGDFRRAHESQIKRLSELVYVLDEALKNPDEIYLFKGKNLYYYTYLEFFQDRAVLVDISFSISQPFRIDRLQELKGDAVDRARKEVLFYGNAATI